MRTRSYGPSRPRTCSWCRSIDAARGTGTTPCSESSSSRSCIAPNPRSLAKLHLRAADWYEANGSPVLALEHLFDTPEQERAAALMTALVIPTYGAGQISTVQRWLSTIGDASVEAHAPLAVFAAWISALAGDTREAQRWADVVDRASSGSVRLRRARQRSIRLGRCCGRSCAPTASSRWWLARSSRSTTSRSGVPGGTPRSPCTAKRTCSAAIPTRAAPRSPRHPGWPPARATTAPSRSARPSSRCWPWTTDGGPRRPNTRRRRWRRSRRIGCTTMRWRRSRSPGPPVCALHRGDLDETHRQLARGMRSRPTCTFVLPWLAVRLRLQLAKVYVALTDATTARHLLREIDDVLLHRPSLGTLVDEVAELRQTLSTTTSEGVAAVRPSAPQSCGCSLTSRRTSPSPRSPSRLFVSSNTVRSQVGSIYRKLGVVVAERSGAAGHRDRAARRVGRPAWAIDPSPRRCRSRAPWPGLGAAATTQGSPTMSTTPISTATISSGARASRHRDVGLGSIGRRLASHGDEGGEADQRQRLRIELATRHPAGAPTRPSARRASLSARSRSRSV